MNLGCEIHAKLDILVNSYCYWVKCVKNHTHVNVTSWVESCEIRILPNSEFAKCDNLRIHRGSKDEAIADWDATVPVQNVAARDGSGRHRQILFILVSDTRAAGK